MTTRFNAPPNWPAPPPGWTPPPGWQPDPSWGPPPDGWRLWVDEHTQLTDGLPHQQTPPGQPQKAWYQRWWAIAGAAVLGLIIIAGVAGKAETPDPASAGAVSDSTEKSNSPAPSASSSTPAPAPAPPTSVVPPPPPPPPPAPVLSPGQQNALRSAEDYLDYTSFSREGLIEQLEYEGYSNADATWAVDQLSVDWNQQAALKAAEYLDYTSFSRQGLVEQLVYEGFTSAEAEYGASQAYGG